ncbi:integrase [Tardibacter chloracetimidivorans]|uniref:Integrase n=1 Tax=Tardibacter chloracetimidivorans TaxID=1921510 RepID=A0A1L3ZT37_9SPHN|nr:integrase arm-type DNA-binding domain-containing protein [Tardibacter chloracetimidivorans]API58802.1 integrase [Tardibacter chloracetimidivorans]
MALTDVAIRNARPAAKPYKLADSGGLYLLVTPAGGKLWRLKFRVAGKEKLLSLGCWPDVSLAVVRKERDKAREALAAGADPAREKQQAKHRAKVSAANSFGEIAQEFIDKRRREGLSTSTADKSEYYISRMGPVIARMPIAEIAAPDLLAVLRRIEAKGNYETARRVLQLAGRVFRYAVATARLTSDPSRDLRGALTAPQPKHYGAIIEAKRTGELLRAMDGYEGQIVTKLALLLSPHVFVRPGEMRHAEWEEIDLDAGLWIIPASKMKMRKPHHVPLSRQSVELFRQLHAITGPSGYVFPSIRTRTRPMSENTVNAGLRRLGFSGDEMTAHGFRAMASTLLNESGKWHPDAIERALAHGDDDRVRAAYHRGAHWKERVEMAQWWSDYLDQLRKGADIVKFPDRQAV